MTSPSSRNNFDFTRNLSGTLFHISGDSESFPKRRIPLSVPPYGSGELQT